MPQGNGSAANLNAVHFLDSLNGIAVYRSPLGVSGAILTTDGGSNWSPSTAFVGGLEGVQMLNARRVIAGGSGIHVSTDGGHTWTRLDGDPTRFFSVAFADSNNGVIVGQNSSIMKTSDGGISWSQTYGIPGSEFHGVSLPTANAGTVVGLGGAILRTRTGGMVTAITNKVHSIPVVTILRQNYPNPFNPTTIISYRLDVLTRVQVGVYDILGREVVLLVDEVQNPGEKTLRFDGSSYASGVYFLRLRAGENVELRKMLLLR
jgi:photosystem II stability/assembly factor-like uncharacterized protein